MHEALQKPTTIQGAVLKLQSELGNMGKVRKDVEKLSRQTEEQATMLLETLRHSEMLPLSARDDACVSFPCNAEYADGCAEYAKLAERWHHN